MTKEIKTSKTKESEKKESISKPKEKEINSPSKIAVIKTGGKQYLVQPGKKYSFERLDVEIDSKVVFDEVYLLIEGDSVQIGKPVLSLKVTGKVIDQFKDKKVNVLKYKKRKRYRKSYGHRQPMTKVLITKIG